MAKVDPEILHKDFLFTVQQKVEPCNSKIINAYSMDPLLAATQDLFGEEHARNFPVLAGSHLPNATKSCDSIDPETGNPATGWLWCFLSIAIAERRGVDASLFVEDAGFVTDPMLTEADVESRLKEKAKRIANNSQILCGENLDVPFKEIFISWKKLLVNSGEYGTALICAPYTTLAQKAYPDCVSSESSAQKLIDMSLDQWKQSVTLGYAPRR